MHLLASSTMVWDPPLITIVTALLTWQSSITINLLFSVPNEDSLTTLALPNFSLLISENLGIILPPVAKAINSIS